jgi:hypothetical protein
MCAMASIDRMQVHGPQCDTISLQSLDAHPLHLCFDLTIETLEFFDALVYLVKHLVYRCFHVCTPVVKNPSPGRT